jgi:hypothetical protein
MPDIIESLLLIIDFNKPTFHIHIIKSKANYALTTSVDRIQTKIKNSCIAVYAGDTGSLDLYMMSCGLLLSLFPHYLGFHGAISYFTIRKRY